MAKVFALETLSMRMADNALAGIDLHLRLQRALRELILDGALASGCRLPATRVLATSLHMSRDTVETAYWQLQRDGYITRRAGAGSFVSASIGVDLVGGRQPRIGRRINAPVPHSAQGLSQRGRRILEEGGVVDHQRVRAFATGLPETRAFPVALWERLQRQVTKEHRDSILLHGDPQGAEPLRQVIAEYVNLERGARVRAEQVVVLSSTRQALYLCAQMLVDAGQPIAMEEPGYFGARKAFTAAQLAIVPIPVDAQGIQTDVLWADKSGANTVYITPSHHYPSGVTLSLERRMELTRWATKKNGWIIEDDYDSEYHYEGLPTACVQGIDKGERTIYIGTFSKTLYPGLRMGYMVLPPSLVTPMVALRSIVDGHTPQVTQLTLARFMADGHYGAHVRALRKTYEVRRTAILAVVHTHLAGIATASAAPGGLQVLCVLAPGWSEAQTVRCAAQAGIVLPGLARLYSGPPAQQGWLLGFSGLTGHEIEMAMQTLATVLHNNRARCFTPVVSSQCA